MNYQWMDVRGAGAQRSDPKDGDPGDYPAGFGPQGDCIRIFNYVRLVRTASASGTDVDDNGSSDPPDNFILAQNYPNPFNPETLIAFSLPSSGHVSLRLFNALGREVALLTEGFLASGNYEFSWNAEGMSAGIFFYSLTVDGARQGIRKMTLLK